MNSRQPNRCLFLLGMIGAVAACGAVSAEPVIIDLKGERADGMIYFEHERLYGGISLAAGDLDGNGVDEIIVGAPLTEGERGRIHIFFNLSLDQAPVIWDLAGLPADVQVATIIGDDRSDWFGYSVAVGDYNGDGRDDLAVGAPNASSHPFNSRRLAGIAYVFLAGQAALTPGVHDAGDAWIALHGAGENDGVGTELAFGDLSGDGIDDLVAAARFGNKKKTRKYLDRVYVSYGAPDHPAGAVVDFEDYSDLFLHNVHSRQYASINSNSLAVRDVIGDGIPDLIVGCQYSYNQRGWVYVLRGAPRPPGTSIDLGREADIAIQDDRKVDYLGAAVSAGDVDGDGDTDLILGAPSGLSSQRGKVVLLLADGKPDPLQPTTIRLGADRIPFFDLHILHGFNKYERLGRGLVVGDWNNDGIDDIAVGAVRGRDAKADNARGRLYMVPGQAAWPEGTVRIDEVPNLVTFIGESKRDEFGMALAVAQLGTGPCIMASAWKGDGPKEQRGNGGEVFLFSQWLSALSPTGLRAHVDREPGAKDLYFLSRRWMTPADPSDHRLHGHDVRPIGPEDLREFHRQKRWHAAPR